MYRNYLLAFPLGPMLHDNAACGITAVAPRDSIPLRSLVPPCDAQARNLSSVARRTVILDQREPSRTGSPHLLALSPTALGQVLIGLHFEGDRPHARERLHQSFHIR